ncbi:MAG: DUF501 domain-containing protein [Actinomycetota bacterium]|nr:DUF501 domain-containing protein [Actinomycetota bacterium]
MDKEKQIVELQIGRKLRSESKVVSKCHLNLPTVIEVPPNLDDGTPFPTTFWLTCPMYNKKIGSLESNGMIKDLDEQLDNNSLLRAQWENRQKSYKEYREKLKDKKSAINPQGGVGGAANSIKCLHAHTADELATNQNIIGKIVIETLGSFNCENPCYNSETLEKNQDWKVIW